MGAVSVAFKVFDTVVVDLLEKHEAQFGTILTFEALAKTAEGELDNQSPYVIAAEVALTVAAAVTLAPEALGSLGAVALENLGVDLAGAAATVDDALLETYPGFVSD